MCTLRFRAVQSTKVTSAFLKASPEPPSAVFVARHVAVTAPIALSSCSIL